jgi:hypothetical protein
MSTEEFIGGGCTLHIPRGILDKAAKDNESPEAVLLKDLEKDAALISDGTEKYLVLPDVKGFRLTSTKSV